MGGVREISAVITITKRKLHDLALGSVISTRDPTQPARTYIYMVLHDPLLAIGAFMAPPTFATESCLVISLLELSEKKTRSRSPRCLYLGAWGWC